MNALLSQPDSHSHVLKNVGMSAAHCDAASIRRVEELGRIIMAYSEVTEKLQQSHDQLKLTGTRC